MSGRITKIVSAILVVSIAAVICMVYPKSVFAAPKSVAYISVDVNTGRVLSSKNADSPRHPASLTKMMTLYVIFDAIEHGDIHMHTHLNVSKNAASKPASKLYLKAGSTITVREAIDALIVKSANDVATVVAESLGGTEAEFGRIMTRTARSIGMSKTTFVNASGLHDERQVTTARDMYTLGLALQDRFPKLYTRFGQSSFVYRGKRIGGHNPFLGRWRGVDGIKTGYTRASGFNLVTNYKNGRRHVVAVVIGSDTSAKRNATMQALLNHSIRKSSNSWRRTAMLDTDVSIKVHAKGLNPPTDMAITASLLPKARPETPSNMVTIQVAEGPDPDEMILPPRKPQLLIDHPSIYTRDMKTLTMLVELYQNEYEKLNSEPNSQTASNEPVKIHSTAKSKHQMYGRPQIWGVGSEVFDQNTSNVSFREDEFETVSCMKSSTCFVSGMVTTEGGHYRVENSELFALVTRSDGG